MITVISTALSVPYQQAHSLESISCWVVPKELPANRDIVTLNVKLEPPQKASVTFVLTDENGGNRVVESFETMENGTGEYPNLQITYEEGKWIITVHWTDENSSAKVQNTCFFDRKIGWWTKVGNVFLDLIGFSKLGQFFVGALTTLAIFMLKPAIKGLKPAKVGSKTPFYRKRWFFGSILIADLIVIMFYVILV